VEEDCDADGTPDRSDLCPRVPGIGTNRGCPRGDRDRDGLTGDEDPCPDRRDCDGDRVLDGVDQCPRVPGTRSNDGCPTWTSQDGTLLAHVEDQTSDWTLPGGGLPYLDILAVNIYLIPEAGLVRFEVVVSEAIPDVPADSLHIKWLLDPDRDASSGNLRNDIGVDLEVGVLFQPGVGWSGRFADVRSGENSVFLRAFEIRGPLAVLWVPLGWLAPHTAFHWVTVSFLGETPADLAPDAGHRAFSLP
jgi:hypothetical protein